MRPDKETAEHMREGDLLRQLTESEGWGIARERLMDHLRILDSVSSIPDDLSFEEIGKEAMFRARAISVVRAWIDEIESRVEQHNQQSNVLAEIKEETIVRTYSTSA